MKKTLLIIGGLVVVGGATLVIYRRHRVIDVTSVDYVNKRITVYWNGTTTSYTYGTPSIGAAKGGLDLAFSSSSNIIQVTLRKNGQILNQENINVVQ